MALISDSSWINKLKEKNITIETSYIVDDKIQKKSTDNKYNDDIVNGVRCKKEYYLNNNLIHTENKFDTRMEYTYINKYRDNKEYTCPNCSYHAHIKDFHDGCPFCGTYFNLDYANKNLGSKFHYDRVIRNTTYRIITAFVDLIISLLLAYIFIKTTSRTFNSYDITKIFIYGTILSLILYYFFYIMDAYIVLGPIKRYKDKQNKKQIAFWKESKIDQKKFFNNLNYEISKFYYNKNDIIDFDILDFDSFALYTKDNNKYVRVTAYIRLIYFNNSKITSKYLTQEYTFKNNKDGVLELNNDVNIITCPNCSASIDATKKECKFCNTKINYLQEWILDNK